MKPSGRPLRFLSVILVGWGVLRVAVLLPEAATMGRQIASDTASNAFPPFAPRLDGERWGMPPPLLAANPTIRATRETKRRASPAYDVQLALLGRIGFGEPQRSPRPAPVRPALLHPLAPPIAAPTTRAVSRLSGSAWLIARDGGNVSLGPAGQLGGSQAGVRLRYAIGTSRQVALSARLSGPLSGRGDEAALGVEWRPNGSPVALLLEQRIGLDGTPGGPAAMAVGGIAPIPLAGRFTIEGYGQGGAVLRGGRAEPFADGALRVAMPVTGTVTAGVGTWGGVQRGAARLDIGPSIAVALPVAGRNIRLGLDWRQRVAGNARPDSGPALTLGSDF